jgi:lysophospholipase L1-like esterase
VHRFIQASALALASISVALAVTEVALRLAGFPRGGVFTVSSAEFEQIPGILDPNQDTVVREIPQIPYRVRTNNLGYRGEDFSSSKPNGEFRILFVGDSFVFGMFVDDEKTLPAQTERALSLQCARPVRIINAGLGGSTITEHSEMIERGLSLAPDFVILQFSENDVSDLAGGSMWDELEWNRRAKSRFPLSVVYPYIRSTALWNLTLHAVAGIRERRAVERYSGSQAQGQGTGNLEMQLDERAEGAPADRYRTEYRQRLMQLYSSLTARGIPMIMTVMPSHQSVYDHWESDQLDWLERLIIELGIDAVSFFDTFVDDGRGETELYLLPYDGHTSPEGYRIAAEQLSKYLISHRTLSEHCESS